MCLVVLSALLPAASVLAKTKHGATTQVFESAWGQTWQVVVQEQRCEIAQPVPQYGTVHFVASAEEPISFTLQARKDLFAPGDILVTRYSPPWSAHPQPAEALGRALHIQGGGALARGELASEMFWSLQRGEHIRLSGSNAHGQRTIVIELNNIGLRDALPQFLACAETVVQVAWHKLSRTRIGFDVSAVELSPDSKAKLAGIAAYVLQDSTVHKIFVDGHADASGEKRQNQQLSKRRAQGVADYLISLGLTKQRIVVRYHGARYPVADNNKRAGKDMNRRATVRLQRDSANALIAHTVNIDGGN